MKKHLSVCIAVMLAFLTIAAPCSLSFAAAKQDNEGLYKVSESVYADAYMLIDLNNESHPIIAQKNKDKKKYPASLTKIVTAVVVLEHAKNIQEKATVSQNAIDVLYNTDAQLAGLVPGEEVTIEKLLSLIMVYSACDACTVAAEHIAGSISAFVDMMNEWIKAAGCKDTHFTNCEGLHDEDHYTTAADMARITLAAMRNDTFMQICVQPYVEYKGLRYSHTNFMLDDTQPMYYYKFARGIKTGSTSPAGNCVITTAQKGNYRYLAVVMDSPTQEYEGMEAKYSFIDAATLFDWAFENLKYTTILPSGKAVTKVSVRCGKSANAVALTPKEDVQVLLMAKTDPSAVSIKALKAPAELEAPVKKGEAVCKATVSFKGKTLATVDLVTAQSIERSPVKSFFYFLWQHIFYTILAIVLLILLIILCVKIRKKVQKKLLIARANAANKKAAATQRVPAKKQAPAKPKKRKKNEKSEKQKQYEAYKREQRRKSQNPEDYWR